MLTLTPSDSKFKAEILIGKIYLKVTVLHIQSLKTNPHVSQRQLFIQYTQI